MSVDLRHASFRTERASQALASARSDFPVSPKREEAAVHPTIREISGSAGLKRASAWRRLGLPWACAMLAGCGSESGDNDSNKRFNDDTGAGNSLDLGSGNGGGTAAAASSRCGGQSYGGESRPLAALVMMDRSSSMTGTVAPGCPGGINCWGYTSDAIGSFVGAAEADGMLMGINFFPQNENTCELNVYATPQVPIAALPQNGASIQQAIASNDPNLATETQWTPTYPALRGALASAQAFAAGNPQYKTIVILSTDGAPTICEPQGIQQIARLASDALAGVAVDGSGASMPAVETHVIGIGEIRGLNQIAQAGGSGQAVIVDGTNADLARQQFFDAMNAIRGKALPCDYALPTPTSGELDLARINLEFSNAGQSSFVGYVEGAGSCDPTQGGWHFDRERNPTRIVACPASCTAFKAAGSLGAVSVSVGCQREALQ